VQKPDYEHIRVPAVAFYPASRSWQELIPGSPEITGPEKRALAEQVVADVARVRKRMADAFHSGVAASRVIELPGTGHYVFRTNEADVLREMRVFLEGLD
jgi:non-heme chloroperoxidase